MSLRGCLAGLVVALALCGCESQTLARSDLGIIHGEPIGSDEYPSAAQLIVQGSMDVGGGPIPATMPICTATLIAPDVALSAGHCVDPLLIGLQEMVFCVTFEEDQTWMMDPSYQSNPPLPDDAVCSSGAVQHPDFRVDAMPPDGLSNYNDLSLVFLEDAIEDRPFAYMPDEAEAEQLVEQMEVDIVGYGMRDPIDTSTINERYRAHTFINELAEFEMQVGADSSTGRKCHGDSGGPTYVDVETELTESLRVIGVTSRAYAAMEDCNMGGVDMRVDAFLDWIEEAMIQACDDGLRSECDEPGIPRPPLPDEGDDDDDDTGGGAGDSGCSGGNPFQWHGGAPHALGLLVLWRRRSRRVSAVI